MPLRLLSTVRAVEELVLLSEPSMTEARRVELGEMTSSWRAAVGLAAQHGVGIEGIDLEALKPYIGALNGGPVCECD